MYLSNFRLIRNRYGWRLSYNIRSLLAPSFSTSPPSDAVQSYQSQSTIVPSFLRQCFSPVLRKSAYFRSEIKFSWTWNQSSEFKKFYSSLDIDLETVVLSKLNLCFLHRVLARNVFFTSRKISFFVHFPTHASSFLSFQRRLVAQKLVVPDIFSLSRLQTAIK